MQRRSILAAPAVARACAVLGAVVGVLAVVGLAADVQALRTFGSPITPIAPNAAIGVLIAAVALWLLADDRPAVRALGDAVALVVATLGLASVVEYAAEVDLHIDELLVEAVDAPVRMSPQTGFAFALLGASLLCLWRAARTCQVLAAATLVASYAAFVAIAFEIRTFFGMTGVPGMSLPGAVGLALLAIGVLARRPEIGLTRLLLSSSRGGRLARFGLAGSLAASFLVGVIVYTADRGFDLVSTQIAASIYFLSSGVVVAGVVVTIGYAYDRVDRARAAATQDYLVSEEQSRALIDHAAEAITVLDLDANRLVRVNPAAERLFGRTAEDLLNHDPLDLSPPQQPDGRPSSEAMAEHLEAAGRGETPVFEWLHRDATGRPLECEVRLLRLPHPDRVLIRGSIIEVGERKRAEMALRAMASERAARATAERARDQQALLQRITARLLAAPSVDDVATIFVDEVVSAVGASSGVLFLVEGSELVRRARTPDIDDDDRWSRVDLDADMPSANAARVREAQLFKPGSEAVARYSEAAAVMRERGQVAWGAFPMVVQDEVLGVAAFGFGTEPDDDWGWFLQVIATRVGMALERARLYEAQLAARRELEEAAEQAAAFQRVLEGLARATTRDEVIEIAATLGTRALGAYASTAGILDGDELDVRTYGLPGSVPRLTRLALSADLPGPAAARRQQALWFESADAMVEAYPEVRPFVEATRTGAMVCLPLREWDQPLGFLAAHYHEPRAFGEVDRVVFATLASVTAQALVRASRFETEHETASALQQSLLPARLPDVPRISIAARYSSAGELDVGGDWYDAVEQADGSIVVMVGDVVGRGLSAATAMGQLRSAMSALAIAVDQPRDMLAVLDRYSPEIDGARLATIAIARIDPLNARLQYASAGHVPGVLVRPEGEPQLLEPERSLPLDALPAAPRDEITLDFPEGSTLVLYTDGLIERRGESLDVGLRRLIRTCSSLRTVEVDAMCEHITAALLPRQQRDDVAVLCVRLEAEVSDALRRRFPAHPDELARLRRDLREWLLQAGLEPDRAADLVLAVDEACANAVEHAYDAEQPGEIVVEVSRGPDHEVIASVHDGGRWRDGPATPNRGRGLQIIQAVADDVQIQTGTAGTTVRFRSGNSRAASERQPEGSRGP